MNTSMTTDDIRLELSYDGPALATGRMDVRVLAAAMASTAQLIDDSTRELYGADAQVRIEVGGDFRKGSFTYAIYAMAVAGVDPTTIRQILEWIGLTGAAATSVFGILRWLNGRKAKLKKIGDQVEIRAGGDIQIVNLQIAQLAFNYQVRTGIEGIVAPLENEGIDEMRISAAGAVVPKSVIKREERALFAAPEPAAEQLGLNEGDAVLQIVSPVFRVTNSKWQFAYPGEAAFFAPILDADFVKRIRRREEHFSFGDLVRVRLRTTVTRTESGSLRTEREILRVFEKIEPAEQSDMFSGTE